MKVCWKNDSDLFSLAKEKLFVALVGDILDQMGYEHQFLSPKLKPISKDMVLIGRAMPVLEADFFAESTSGHNEISKQPFGKMFEALDDLKKDEIYICAGASHNYALWGGLMTTRAIVCQAAGAVVHGYHRDTNEIERLDFNVISFGSYAQDQSIRGKVVDWRVPIKLDNVLVKNGDIVYGDRDGILIVPSEIVNEVFTKAFEKGQTENQLLKALKEGMTTVEAYEKFGVM